VRIVLAAGRHAEDRPDPPQTHGVVAIDVFIAVMSTGMMLVLSLIGFQVLAGRARHDGPCGIIYLRRHNSLMTAAGTARTGSVSEHGTTHAHCPVLVFRP
jgi:hypothetical protein